MPNTIKATNLVVTKTFGKFFIAEDTYKKVDGSEGKQKYKIWSTHPVQPNQVVDVIGNASAATNEFVDQQGQKVVYAQLSINAKEVNVTATLPAQTPSSNWDTF